MEFQVIAIAVDISSEPCRFGAIRKEIVDTADPDSPYTGCSTLQDIEFAYERHWNYPADPDLVQNPAAKIKVLMVHPVFAA
jgi:hypothetical protein